ncbi:MAG: hypothetical protein CMO34_00430 [Verrucomicrobia bacterium]|nr:hypothetical protein [Verrucomicrobiota bacterium]|tara:strand:+ start:1321 stop:2022 length:702 start_codon:yes stop_codon:yes gene_type:complete
MLHPENYTPLENARFERKFVADQSFSTVERIIKLNPGAFRPIFQKRQINNVYFDTPNLNNYYDNHFGKSHRNKMRIRWYGHPKDVAKNPVLEFKIKRGLSGLKESFPLPELSLKEFNAQEKWQAYFKQSELPEEVKHQLLNFRPSLLNSYERKYYKSFDNLYRITIDFNLKFYNITRGIIEKAEETQPVIVELKYDLDKNNGASKITAALPFRLGKFSKYAVGIECFHKHLAI